MRQFLFYYQSNYQAIYYLRNLGASSAAAIQTKAKTPTRRAKLLAMLFRLAISQVNETEVTRTLKGRQIEGLLSTFYCCVIIILPIVRGFQT